ncbi:MAG: GGDEF domain-containing protein [Casimicrobiaceae bacterium]
MNPTTTIESALFRKPHAGWTLVALLTIIVVGVVNYLTGPDLSLGVFYLVPVAAIAWVAGSGMAVSASLLAAGAWLAAELGSSEIEADLFVYTWNFCARLLYLLLVALLLARLRAMLARERDLSRTDSLTRLLNARAFREIAEVEIARASRHAHPLSVAFMDIDDFKETNDRRGHAAGDRLLQEMAAVIRASLRGSDVVARYGGDEFVILLPVTDAQAARAVVDKLRNAVRDAMARRGSPVSLSVGVYTTAGKEARSVDFILEHADRLMYEVKSDGKGSVRCATSGD